MYQFTFPLIVYEGDHHPDINYVHFLSFSVPGTVLGLRGALVTSQKSLLSWGVFWVKEADVSTEGNRQASCRRR